MRISYDGTDYHGWQIQPQYPTQTIQGHLQSILSDFLQESIQVDAASRTDAGVHAYDQLCAFNTKHPILVKGLQKAILRRLPASISVRELQEIDLNFQPRYANYGKIYVYYIWNHRNNHPLKTRFATHIPYEIDLDAMSEAMYLLRGTHDFKSFAASNGQHKSTIRSLWHLSMHKESDHLIALRFGANGFMKQMVRNLVGTLLEVGRGKWQVQRVTKILAACDRTAAGPTAAAQGLTLEQMLWP
jgi:tRNA pseudouridine38-40 synthase